MHSRPWVGSRLCALAASAALLLTACAEPPAAEEPTGDELDRAWRIAVGSDPLDRTIARIYSLAMNSRDQPTVVIDAERPAHEAAAALAEGSESRDGEGVAESSAEADYDLVLSRTLPLAEALDPDAYARLSRSEDEEWTGAAPSAQDLTELISDALQSGGDASAALLQPGAAVLSTSALTTAASASAAELDEEESPGLAGLEEQCEDLRFGHREGLPALSEALEDAYGCEPAALEAGEEDELIDQLIRAETDVVLLTSSHPGAEEHALVELSDTDRAFPQDQYAPLIAADLEEQAPEVLEEISEALDDEAITVLRRLLHGEDALSPEEAARYWLVDQEFIAEPADWGVGAGPVECSF